jgi:hypothetical protein
MHTSRIFSVQACERVPHRESMSASRSKGTEPAPGLLDRRAQRSDVITDSFESLFYVGYGTDLFTDLMIRVRLRAAWRSQRHATIRSAVANMMALSGIGESTHASQ